MGRCRPMYGFDGKETENLRARFHKLLPGDNEWSCIDDFLRWAKESGYKTGMHLRKHVETLPHGPANSFWLITDKSESKYRFSEGLKKGSEFCKDCKKKCPSSGMGCKEWQEYWKKNWNDYISIAPPVPVEEPETQKVFRYEHPDLVREGIVFEGTCSV